MTQHERVTAYLTETLGTAPEHLWAKYPTYAVFRHPSSGKWYALLVRLARAKLGLTGDGEVWALVIRVNPLLRGSLLSEAGFRPAYHMNKSNWVTAVLDDALPDSRVLPLIDMSWEIAAPKKGRKP